MFIVLSVSTKVLSNHNHGFDQSIHRFLLSIYMYMHTVNKEVIALTTFYCTYLYASRSDDILSAFNDDGSRIDEIPNSATACEEIADSPSREDKESNSIIIIDPNTTSLSSDYLEVQESFNLTTQDLNNNNNSSNNGSNIYASNSKKMSTASISPVKRYMLPKQRRA